MPFVSGAQKRYMFAKHPQIAKRWVREGKAYVKKKKKSSNYSKEAIEMARKMYG